MGTVPGQRMGGIPAALVIAGQVPQGWAALSYPLSHRWDSSRIGVAHVKTAADQGIGLPDDIHQDQGRAP